MTVKKESMDPGEVLRRLVRQRAALIVRLKEIEDAITLLSSQLDNQLTEDGVRPSPRNTTRASRKRKGINYAREIREFAKIVLTRGGRPMTRGELVRWAEVSGVPLPTGDLAQFIGRVLWRSDEFIHEATGYWLTDATLKRMQSDRGYLWLFDEP